MNVRQSILSWMLVIIVSLTLIRFVDADLNPEALKAMVGVWLFDEGSGNTATDTSGNGREGEIKAPKWARGKFYLLNQRTNLLRHGRL